MWREREGDGAIEMARGMDREGVGARTMLDMETRQTAGCRGAVGLVCTVSDSALNVWSVGAQELWSVGEAGLTEL